MRIGIVRYWAGRPVAEHEVIARFATAAAATGHRLVELNPDGSGLLTPDSRPPVDVVLNLHYLSPKARDVPHVGLLWNPIEFYHNFGFVPHFANQLSHDYLATAGAALIEAAFAPFRPDLFDKPLPVLNHTVPERYLAPTHRTDRRLFYVGVNWERVIGIGGRHNDLLGRLDSVGASEIFGPREIEGMAPWEGYRTYRGELPFDGWSVIEAISRAGTVLVASSPAHYRDGIMSCRPFESAAAGVPMISERHPFMLEHFGDAALFFDERAPVADQAEEILGLISSLNSDPDLAVDLATRAQELVRERFNLNRQLSELCDWVAAQEENPHRSDIVNATAVVVPDVSPEGFAQWAKTNGAVLSRFRSLRIAPPSGGSSWQEAVATLGSDIRLDVGTRADTGWSERAAVAASNVDGPLCFLTGRETLWEGYPDAIAGAVSADGTGLVAGVSLPLSADVSVNDRQPKLLAGAVSDWWGVAVAAIVVTGDRLRALHRLLGPGSHLAVIAEQALAHDHVGRIAFSPVFEVTEDRDERPWSVGGMLGKERHRDALFVQALPSALTADLPPSLFARDVDRPQVGLWTRVAAAVRRSALPAPVSELLIKSGRRMLGVRHTRR